MFQDDNGINIIMSLFYSHFMPRRNHFDSNDYIEVKCNEHICREQLTPPTWMLVTDESGMMETKRVGDYFGILVTDLRYIENILKNINIMEKIAIILILSPTSQIQS